MFDTTTNLETNMALQLEPQPTETDEYGVKDPVDPRTGRRPAPNP